MKAKPYSMIPALVQNTQVGVHPYVLSGGGDPMVYDDHKAGWDILFPARSCLGGSMDLYGFELTGADLTVGTDTGRITIEPSGASPTGVHSAYGLPTLYYKGKAVPAAHLDSYANTTGMFYIDATVASSYSQTAADYVAWYGDWLKAYVLNAIIGDVTLPIESNAFKGVGVDEDVYKVTKRGVAEASGSVSVAFDLTAQVLESGITAQNAAAAEVLSRWYGVAIDYFGNAWDNRELIINDFIDDSTYTSVSVLSRSGKRLDSAAGHVWGVLTTMLGCHITSMDNYENISNDTTDPIAFTLNFITKFPDMVNQTTIYTTG